MVMMCTVYRLMMINADITTVVRNDLIAIVMIYACERLLVV